MPKTSCAVPVEGYNTNRALYSKLSLPVTVVYNISITFSKASVLFLYERIFSIDRRLRLWIRIMMFILVAYLLSASFGLIFTTNPVQAQWDYWIPHTTIDKLPFYIVIGVANLLLDIVILSIPQTIVWKIHQSLKRRISIAAVFMLGGLWVSRSPLCCMRKHFLTP